MKRIKNLPLLVAIVLIGVAGVGFYSIIQSVRNDVKVLTAKTALAAYTPVSKASFEVIEVPQAAIEGNSNILTEENFDKLFPTGVARVIYPFVQGQWILASGLAADDGTTLAAVLPGERVVGATSTYPGASLGAIKAGDVVNVTAGSEGGSAQNAKVLCITTVPSSCSNIVDPSAALVTPTASSSQASTASDAGGIFLLLAVAETDADAIAGTQVSLVLNPFCRIDKSGYLVSSGNTEGGQGCKDDGTGRVGKAATSASSPTTTTTTPTTTSPTTTVPSKADN